MLGQLGFQVCQGYIARACLRTSWPAREIAMRSVSGDWTGQVSVVNTGDVFTDKHKVLTHICPPKCVEV